MTAGPAARLPIGTKIGPYEIVGWLGAGAMGEVYRAHDPRLGRQVAIKLIAETYATDAGRLHRFEQEARAAGQLNHANVLVVFDVGVHAGAPYIVSELLHGESLRSRLQSDRLPPLKVIDYARQTATGLAAAHEHGIVHRDVKPDNLFITDDGRIKIVDFGIAKLTRPADDGAPPLGGATDTMAGMVVGTASYMSPEQIRGETVDGRSDIFSLGTTLHEMLTGCPAFTRGTAADTMAAILKESPAEPLSAEVPLPLARIVSRCLEKAREARFQSTRDLAFALECLSGTLVAFQAPTQNPAARVTWLPPALWVAGIATVLALTVALTRWNPWADLGSPSPLRLSAELGGGVSLSPVDLSFGDAIALSPDGTTVAFVAQSATDEKVQIRVRRLAELEATPLSGTDYAAAPFFSPDGKWIGFFSDGKLKKIAVGGGAPMTLADAPDQRGAWWSDDDTIVFSPTRTAGTRLLRVSAAGGPADALAPLADAELIQLWPQVLPGGRGLLFTSSSIVGAYDDAELVVQTLPGGPRKIVQRGGYHGRYVPSGRRSASRAERGNGHLVYVHEGTLFAVAFDLARLEVTGQPVPAIDGLMSNSITGGAHFSVSNAGTLAYLPGQSAGAGIPVAWMDREGRTTRLRPTLANWFNPLFSPDGGRLAMEIRGASSDLWVYDWKKDMLTRLTSDQAQDARPVWTPDGRRIAFASGRAEKSAPNLYLQSADGAGGAVRLTDSQNIQMPSSFHPSGNFLAFDETSPQTNIDLMILPLDGSSESGWKPGKPATFLSSPAIETGAMFSPDGRWLAYASNESGRPEVYIRPFPGPGGKWQISSDGGMHPTWSPTKSELFYGRFGVIMVARFTVDGQSFRAEKPRPWSEGRYQPRGSNRMFDLHPDGDRFAVAPAAATPDAAKRDKVVFIFNFLEELRRLAPATGP